jgi:hypothetical protein
MQGCLSLNEAFVALEIDCRTVEKHGIPGIGF